MNQFASGPLIPPPTETDELLVSLLAVVQSVPPLLPCCVCARFASPPVSAYRGGNLDAESVTRQLESRGFRGFNGPVEGDGPGPEETTVRIGLISDIHGRLRAEVFDLLAGVDRILFAGDVERLELLDELEVLAPVEAVWGNVDGPDVRRYTKASLEVEFEQVRFAVTHGDMVAPQFETLLRTFPAADVVVHGHSHVPCCDFHGGRWLVNPGAVTRPRNGHPASVAIAQVNAGRTVIRHLSLSDGTVFVP